MMHSRSNGLVSIPAGNVHIEGMLEWPAQPRGVVVFSHGSGSGRRSPRNNFVAGELRQAGLATLLVDLLTLEEDRDYAKRFDIDLLTQRLGDAIGYLGTDETAARYAVGVFGASTGAAAALRIAAGAPGRVRAVVSRGGRPDLAGSHVLAHVQVPTLLIVGSLDAVVLELNDAAYRQLGCEKELAIVPGATHLFEEPGTLEQVSRLAAAWFVRHLRDGDEALSRA